MKLVLDPFCGIGSTMVACRRLEMIGLGFEIDKDYVNASNQRLNSKHKQKDIL